MPRGEILRGAVSQPERVCKTIVEKVTIEAEFPGILVFFANSDRKVLLRKKYFPVVHPSTGDVYGMVVLEPFIPLSL